MNRSDASERSVSNPGLFHTVTASSTSSDTRRSTGASWRSPASSGAYSARTPCSPASWWAGCSVRTSATLTLLRVPDSHLWCHGPPVPRIAPRRRNFGGACSDGGGRASTGSTSLAELLGVQRRHLGVELFPVHPAKRA